MPRLRPVRRLSADGVVEDQADHQPGQRHPRLVGQRLPVRRRDRIGVAGMGEQVELLRCRSASHGHLPESPLGTPMLRSNPAIAMRHRKRLPRRAAMPPELPEPPPRQPGQPHLPGLVADPIEHPDRDLQPPIGSDPGQATAERYPACLLDHLVNVNTLPNPGMPPIEKLAFLGPVGVP